MPYFHQQAEMLAMMAVPILDEDAITAVNASVMTMEVSLLSESSTRFARATAARTVRGRERRRRRATDARYRTRRDARLPRLCMRAIAARCIATVMRQARDGEIANDLFPGSVEPRES